MQIEAAHGEFAGAGGDHVLAALQLNQVAARREAGERGFQLIAAVAFNRQFAHQLFEVGAGVRQLGDVGHDCRVVHHSSNFTCNGWQSSAVSIRLEENGAPTGPPPARVKNGQDGKLPAHVWYGEFPMKRLLLLLAPAALFAGQARYARLGEFEGKVEVQLHAGDSWNAAERNLPLTESVWLRSGLSSGLEIELDEGSAWRLGPETQVEISDYTRLSTGQRLTVLSLDHGVAYFTGEPGGADTLTLVVPGAQVTLLRGARVRLQADAAASRISVIEGGVRLSCPVAEIDIREGQTVRVEPANPARFALDREVPAMDLDRWSEDRDKRLAASSSASHVAQRYGVVDLDSAGEWVQTDVGAVWKRSEERRVGKECR